MYVYVWMCVYYVHMCACMCVHASVWMCVHVSV